MMKYTWKFLRNTVTCGNYFGPAEKRTGSAQVGEAPGESAPRPRALPGER